MRPGQSALDPRLLARLSSLNLRARAVVEGLLSGLHKSPHQGQSVEFSEHKEYSPGDEIRHVDWKAYGKFDRYYIKRFEHETNLRAYLVVDASASMATGSGPLTKLEVAATAAAALALLLVRQQDQVGLCLLQGGKVELVPPRSSAAHAKAIVERLSEARPEGITDLAAAAQLLAERARRRSLILVFSDLFEGGAGDPVLQPGLRDLLQLRALSNELSFFHVLDPAELLFPFEDPTLFLDMEGDRRLEANPLELRDGYLEELGRFLDRTRSLCRERDSDYELLRTDEPLDQSLVRFLARRGRRGAGGA
ncbi:MAG: DUF58 domain-containing protein [Deltaproteobacteria bacterium]